LSGAYEIHALEQATHFDLSTSKDHLKYTGQANLRLLLGDLAVVCVRGLLPEPMADRWLPIDEGVWGGLLENLPLLRHETREEVRAWQDAALSDWQNKDIMKHSDGFLAELAKFPRNTFHFLHVMLPHHPFRHLPSGRIYDEPAPPESPLDPAARRRLDQRIRHGHILQVALTDKILGEFIAELKRLALYEESLFIVVADHGISFDSKVHKRVVVPESFGAIGFVPLFIKYPNQKEGNVDLRNVQVIDIAPTVLDVLNAAGPLRMDGVSLVDPEARFPESKFVMNRADQVFRIVQEEYLALRQLAFEDSIEFFDLTNPGSSLFYYGFDTRYLGSRAVELRDVEIACVIDCPDVRNFASVDLLSGRVPAVLTGSIEYSGHLRPEGLILGISVNGIVRGLTKPYDSAGQVRFYVTLSDDYLEQGANEVQFHLLPDPKSAN
jgi:hypothetical protein